MSFGVVQTMIITLKNNDNLRSKSVRFKNEYRRKVNPEKPEYDFPKATPELLIAIEKKLKKDNRILRLKVVIITVLILSLLVGIIIK
ncbi:hypothetical protein HNV08_12395 [Winogradskyella eckloniae]|uniref:hypothetical protein n=1 Tax=Winogradskyella eckloniae TaxID=1089306 RepID=UPI0015631F8F|nr:hypothetical protein [Winogradskyella eckloniae]NRD20848.1 hypothetical protein [Winogradskyella eckloniae]